ncbi:hypothetical protein ACTOB_000999 [Actinoplanes oblitus]|uniref:Uncharacterized protein n=1 Tax=Actinoplanes oblitus TaxID=3040509 RepID=A0ABY8WK42_9ACTN|nr:hypothetical protein [Actinoplanes oblitus]WIM97473.1 hypothetical protein ACTOB_000999 [Actinoplanes oblitus]
MGEDLGAVLRREAGRHVPDSDAMFDRINRGRFAAAPVRAPRPFPWFTGLRPVAAAASVVATLVAGFTGIRILTADQPDRTPTATTNTASASPPARSPLPPATSSSPAGRPKHAGGDPARPHGDRTSAPQSSSAYRPVSDFVSTTGVLDPHSTDVWAQSDVTLTTAKEVTALDLAISVARTEGVRSTGSWSTIPTEMITIGVTEEKDALIYRFTLKPGGTLAAGAYVFAAQYEHAAAGRATGADRYGAFVSAGDQKVEVTGAFTAS